MSQTEISQSEVTVNLENGLHLVPCSRIAEVARQYETCEVMIRKSDSDQTVDAKTIFDLMTLGATKGVVLSIETRGEFADEVMQVLVRLFENDFKPES